MRVLAIIGVLSVGALSGYSKAILKYRLNKSSQELSYLLSVSFEYLQSKTPKNGNSNTDNIIPYLITLDSVPEYMLKDGYTDRLFDSLENQIVIQDTTDWRRMYFTINENLTASNETNIAYCIQMMNVTKLYYDNISSASLLTDDGNTTIYKGTHNSNSAYPRLDTSDSLTICKNGFKRLMILLQK